MKNCSFCQQIEPIAHNIETPSFVPSSCSTLHWWSATVDIVGKLPDSCDFNHIVTAKDVVSKYLFASP